MPVARVPSPLCKRLLVLIWRSPPILVILFLAIPIATFSFQFPGKNGMQHSRQIHAGVDCRIMRPGLSSLLSPPSAFMLQVRGIQRLPTSLFSSYPLFPQHGSVGTESESRDMGSLSAWARGSQIVFADGIELTEDAFGDWSLSTTKLVEQGTPVLTVPSQVILTSDISGDSFAPYYSERDMETTRGWMETELENGSQSKQDYLPEYMLVYKLIREVCLGSRSRWYSWWKSLPTKFSTGLYLDEVERNHVERMTGDFIKVQGLQYKACLELFHKLVSSNTNRSPIPAEFHQWILGLQQSSNDEGSRFDDLVKWAFTIVFTRSWRSPDRKQAQIVPLGDLANHDSQFANLKPGFRQADGAFQFFVTNDVGADSNGPTSPLYLSYGLTHAPARYLVLFGFCDVTAGYIDANLDFLREKDSDNWPTTLEPSQLVISTTNGALAEDVWLAFLYKVLEAKEPELLIRVREAFAGGDKARGVEFLEHLLETWEWEVGLEIQSHYQRLLETDFVAISVTENDLSKHPNLSMIINYNLYVRETYIGVMKHIDEFLTQCRDFQELSASRGRNSSQESGIKDRTASGNSIVHFQSDSREETNQIPTGDIIEKKLSKSLTPMGESVSTRFVSSELNNTQSTFARQTNNTVTERLATSNYPVQTFQNQTNSSTGNLNEQAYSNDRVSQELDPKSLNYVDNLQENISSISRSTLSVGMFDPRYHSKSTLKSRDTSAYAGKVDSNPSEQRNSTAPPNTSNDTQSDSTTAPAFSFGDPGFQSHSIEQASQVREPTETPNTSIRNVNFRFDSDRSPHSLYCNSNSVDESSKSVNSTVNFPEVSQYSQNFLNTSSKYVRGTFTSQSYSNMIDSTPTPEFPAQNIYSRPFSAYGTPKSESFSPDLPSVGGIDSTSSPQYLGENFDSQSNSEGQTVEPMNALSVPQLDNENTNSEPDFVMTNPSQEAYDPVAAYTKSLLSDQRGDTNRQQQIEQSVKSPKEDKPDGPSTATTYEEYIQQRRAIPSDGIDRSSFDTISYNQGRVGGANVGNHGETFSSPTSEEFDYGGDFEI
mmetsp:Transcript_592/g.1422  ORF Transcript_592/g.1422 Transcript_592/m.1422 type:complete len:1052 (+) Transcript_592:263-3418(+)